MTYLYLSSDVEAEIWRRRNSSQEISEAVTVSGKTVSPEKLNTSFSKVHRDFRGTYNCKPTTVESAFDFI